ncbi:hypothetical protein NCCP2222_16460 [Sporosarcina sp. NCCP-2222]|uniref:stalk domain-containing protein n=1 Tax=Sporosarcina sp. NCCP-2222 TaxID=2935073 RepID=UPI002080AAA1|nr:stalk domain-containing protein [Sporosarcina sp. NCCP-2222]GKV55699.1 hypothetical protein NCCP2222_16460 [Sporosarcina sp. NCCP-2222]
MKTIMRTLVLLVLINAVLLYMHYSQMEGATGKGSETAKYDQEIEVTQRNDGLYIRQHFKGLENGRYEIVWPELSENEACYIKDKSSCTRMNDSVTAILEGDAAEQSISYQIPIKSSDSTILYENIFAKLRNGTVGTTMLHVTDETNSGGVWISELDRIGTKKLNRIEYTMFYGMGKTDLLYWQNKELPEAYRSEQISIFGKGIHKEQAARLEGLLKKVDAPHMTVVVGTNQKPFMKGRLVLTDQVDTELLETRLIQYGVMARYGIASSERMTANIAASLLIGEPFGNGTAKKAYEKITEKLSSTQLEQLNKKLGSTSKLDPQTLDQLIGEVSGLKTTFLEHAADEQYGFYFEDPRELKVKGEKAEGVSVLLEDGQVFYSGKELFRQLGYTLESNQQSIYITNETDKFRFSLRDPFYVFNERKYSLRTKPYKKMNGAYYFEEDAIKRIFSLKIQKTDEAIDVSSAEGKEGETDK